MYVSSGLTLFSFVVLVISVVIRYSLQNKKDIITSAPPEKRVELISQALESYHINTETLTKEQKYNIVIEQLQQKRQRHRTNTRSAIVVLCITAIVACFGYTDSKRPDTLEKVQITGIVHDFDDNPIIGAKITVEAHDFYSESRTDGSFEGTLYDVTKGDPFKISIMHRNYYSEPIFKIFNDETIELHTIRLKKLNNEQ